MPDNKLGPAADQVRVRQLLEDVLDSGSSLEEACRESPELLPQVRKRWERVRAIQAQVGALFPAPESTPGPGITLPVRPLVELPQIPGYDVQSILGRGGMGVVFKAWHVRLRRPVALKMLLVGACATAAEKERFLREAEAVAGLAHPNIVQVHDVGEHDGRPYFTMEFVDGVSLAEKLKGTPQPPREAAAVVATLAQAVHVAHQSGIIHRDLKPANVLLTADATPKISDFGLARRLEDAPGLTMSGAALGTPSYMAPEQAQGKSRAVGPAADIYALGVILYELLTGRPPFRAESAAETVEQVISQEPAPPSRLNAKVPRDLETICLKCLQKDRERRYGTAAEIAADLERFLRHEPIHARPVGRVERSIRWVRRNPTGTALIITALALIGLVIGEGVREWAIAAGRRAEKTRLTARWESGVRLAQLGRYSEARAILGRLGDGGFDDLRRQIDQTRHDLDLVIELDRIRLNRETSAGYLAYYKSKADRAYLKAFENSGLAIVQDSSDTVAARIKESAVRLALVAALDDWAVCAADKTRRDWLLAIARETDRQAQGWGDRIRASATWEDLTAISELAETVPVNGQPVSLLLALGERLRTAGGDATGFLKNVQKNHPADFWANIVLGNALFSAAPVEAAGYYRAALSSRPEAPVAYTALGDALRIQGRMDEANGYYRQALQIDPNYARGHSNLGNFLSDMGQKNEAIASFRTAIKVDPNYAWAHLGLANALSATGQADEALEHYRAFHSLGPSIPHIANILRSDLVTRGRGEEVRQEWKKSLDLDPPHHDAWFGYAELCLFLGDEAEYRRAVHDLIQRFGDTTDPSVAEKTARAILLAPPSEEELQTALALADRAVAAKSTTAEWVYPYFLFAKGLAEYRQGHFDSAISIMDRDAAAVMGPCPLLVIAMARHRLGDEEKARAALAKASGKVDWSMAHVRSHDQWIWHVLRREAEALIIRAD